ncbi:mediator of RNA polymerase II transcription subunit 9 [Hemicordylus capensis]|uniref:mediator of RNA polymerase II transcription subunit 9 n=1 Tax=Hemicordylus capensis TaxID=884348 RepID=UPI0023041DBC|nr:mediator of RNA polymerase II transcription subunit 9 [Hemicordylus capensis]
MATPGAAAVGGPRSGLDEQPPGPPPGAAPAAAPQATEQPPAPAPPQQPSPAEQKFQPPPAQPPPSQAQQQQPPPAAAPQHQGQEDYSFLPLVHDIIKCMDKDSPDVHQVLNELRTKFVEMRKLIKTMQGISVSPEQQQQQLQSLREQVRTKSELLQKYKSLCMFEIPKE